MFTYLSHLLFLSSLTVPYYPFTVNTILQILYHLQHDGFVVGKLSIPSFLAFYLLLPDNIISIGHTKS